MQKVPWDIFANDVNYLKKMQKKKKKKSNKWHKEKKVQLIATNIDQAILKKTLKIKRDIYDNWLRWDFGFFCHFYPCTDQASEDVFIQGLNQF
jgi:hypothetical protein